MYRILVQQWHLPLLFCVVLASLCLAKTGAAHDIPDEILIRSYVKPEGDSLTVMHRIPLAVMEGLSLPKRGPGYLDLSKLQNGLDQAMRATATEFSLYENGVELTPLHAQSRISLPSEDSFTSFEQARDHIRGPALSPEANVFWNQGYFDVLLKYPIRSDRSEFALSIDSAFGLSGRMKMFVEFRSPGSPARLLQIHGDKRWIPLDPSWRYAAGSFVSLGFHHILEGIDHLLFLLCLALPFRLRQFWPLLAVVTSFTIGHSITLVAAAFGIAPSGNWFPPLIEALIALSIVYMAAENIVSAWFPDVADTARRRRWVVTGLFGLVHGFGFSFLLREELQFAGSHVMLSLVSFNVGVELGQVLFLILVLPVLSLVFKGERARRACIALLSALVAHTAWHWMLERFAGLEYVQWPDVDIAAIIFIALPLGIAVMAISGTRFWIGRQRRRGSGDGSDIGGLFPSKPVTAAFIRQE